MIKINNFLDINNDEMNERVSIILDVNLPDEEYIKNNLNVEEYPKDAWSVEVSQIDEDRECKGLWMDLCNEGLSGNMELDEEERKLVINYIIENDLDLKYGLIIR